MDGESGKLTEYKHKVVQASTGRTETQGLR